MQEALVTYIEYQECNLWIIATCSKVSLGHNPQTSHVRSFGYMHWTLLSMEDL
jgi:hypothetical protein